MARTIEDLERELAREKQRQALAEKERDDADARVDDLIAKKEQVDANRATLIETAIKGLKDENADLRKRLDEKSYQPSIEDQDAIAAAYHRANRVYSMLGDAMPLSMPGESSLRYRKRLANGLRQHTRSWKLYTFHDSQQAKDFDLVENAIYAEAEYQARNPPRDQVGKIREIVTTAHGKTRVEFVGDARLPWLPFQQPVKFAVTSIRPPEGEVYRK